MLLLVEARLRFVCVNQAPLCQTAGCMEITKSLQPERRVIARLAVYFMSDFTSIDITFGGAVPLYQLFENRM